MLELLRGKPARPVSKQAAHGSTKESRRSKPYPPIVPSIPLRVAEPYTPYGASSQNAGTPIAAVAGNPFKISTVENLAAKLNIPADNIMTILGITGRTAQRRWQEGELTLEESDRLYRIARIVHRAMEVLGSEEGASHWLKRPQAHFSGTAPLLLLGSDAGAKTVEEQLGRIDHGIFA